MEDHFSLFLLGEQSFFLDGPAGKIEAMSFVPKSPKTNDIAVICHPHPLHEGTMHNKVVTTLAKAYAELGIPSVRFNFRGVGKSEGTYGETIGELLDLKAVIAYLTAHIPNLNLYLAGFSFGSYIAAKGAQEAKPRHLISIAPPVNHYDFESLLPIPCPWLVVQGDNDEVIPPEAVFAFFEAHPQAEFQRLPGVGHFFHGRLMELKALCLQSLKSLK